MPSRGSTAEPDGRKETVANLDGGPNGAAIGPDGALYITSNGGSFEWLDHDGLTIPGPTPASHRGGSIQRVDLGGVTIFDPDGTTEHVAVPDVICTNICFGGADMQDAWITASATGKLFKTRWPRPGLKLNVNA